MIKKLKKSLDELEKETKLSKEKTLKITKYEDSEEQYQIGVLKKEIEILKENQDYKEIEIPTLKKIREELNELKERIREFPVILQQFKKELWQDCLDLATAKSEETIKEFTDKTSLKIFGFAIIRLEDNKSKKVNPKAIKLRIIGIIFTLIGIIITISSLFSERYKWLIFSTLLIIMGMIMVVMPFKKYNG